MEGIGLTEAQDSEARAGCELHVSDANCDQEVNVRIGKAAGVFLKLGKLLKIKKNQFAGENKAL